MPGLHKEGYSEGNDASPSSSNPNPRRGSPARDPAARPQPVLPPHGPERIFGEQTYVNPLEIGRRDLDPLGIDPLGGFGPPPLFPGSGGGDGMFVGPNHPIFGQRGRGTFPPNRGPWGGDGYLPPMGAPPGARFDPVVPFFGGTRLGPRGGQPGGGNLRGPDNDEFMPPGAVSTTWSTMTSTDDLTRETCLCERKKWKWTGCTVAIISRVCLSSGKNGR